MMPKLGSQMTDFEKLIALVSSVLIPNLNVIDPFHGFNPIKKHNCKRTLHHSVEIFP